MIDSIAEQVVSFLIGHGGFAEHQDMPLRHLDDFDAAIAYLIEMGVVSKRVSSFDGLTTYRLID